MLRHPGVAVIGLWTAWALSWLVAAAWSARTEGRPDVRSEVRYRIPMVIGTILMLIPAHRYEGPLRLWHVSFQGAWFCVAAVAAGIAFAWWARLHLGRLWSGRITRKAEHRVVDSGPYAWVRHPIYAGLLVALFATGVVKGTILGLGGFFLLLLGIWMKAQAEEHWLIQELGENAYREYQQRVPMLFPRVPKNR